MLVCFVCLMVFNATFNNISVILWRSILLVEETGDLEKTTDLSQVTDKRYHINKNRPDRDSNSQHQW